MPDTSQPSGSAAALTRVIHARQHEFLLQQIDGLIADLARTIDERDALKARVVELEMAAEPKPKGTK